MLYTDDLKAQDDLECFFQAHFAKASTHTTADCHEPVSEVTDAPDDDEDALGYYADGTKRTLTDEQIAMFRHSEIQALVRARRRRQEAGEPEPRSEDDDGAGSAVASQPASAFATAGLKRRDGPGTGEASTKSRSKKEKRENWQARQRHGRGEVTGKTSRRLARERDVMGEAPVELDYE